MIVAEIASNGAYTTLVGFATFILAMGGYSLYVWWKARRNRNDRDKRNTDNSG